jgi:hypothetical protein
VAVKYALLALVLIASLVALVGYTAAEQPPPRADRGRAFARPPSVAVLVLENRSYEQIIGSAEAPYINRLARRYALATNYYALTHPSLPNYLGLTGGSLFGMNHNCQRCRVSGQNLVGQLAAHGHTWKAYFEALGSNRRPGPISSEYNPHYNPFVYFQRVRKAPAHRRRIVDFTHLSRDLRHRRLPEFSWIAPGVLHDGHDGSLADADHYASKLVPRLLRALGPDGVLYLTWDEGVDSDRRGAGGEGGGRIPLIAAGGGARRRTQVATLANHYALLRTIEAGFGLRALGNAGDDSTPLLRGLLSGRPRTAGRSRRGA